MNFPERLFFKKIWKRYKPKKLGRKRRKVGLFEKEMGVGLQRGKLGL